MIVLLLLAGSLLLSQEAAKFEAASVKMSTPVDGPAQVLMNGNRVVLRNTTLSNALARAFGLKFRAQLVAPSWMNTEYYEIIAKAPNDTPREQLPRLLRDLLVERFAIKFRRQTKEIPAYQLQFGKSSLKMEKASTAEHGSIEMVDGKRVAKSMRMAELAQLLSLMLREPVVDHAEDTGSYDFPLDYAIEERGGPDSGERSIFTIITELGLKLERSRTALEVIIIESGNKTPIQN